MCFLLLFVVCSCSKRQADEPKPEQPPTETPVTPANVTYANFAQGLLETNCKSCHSRGAGGWTFDGYATVTANAARIQNVVFVTRTMPRGRTISPENLVLLKAWFDKGMPQ